MNFFIESYYCSGSPILTIRFYLGNDHEIEFHEIEIAIFQEIKSFVKLIMRSKLAFFRRSKLFAKLIRRSKRPCLSLIMF